VAGTSFSTPRSAFASAVPYVSQSTPACFDADGSSPETPGISKGWYFSSPNKRTHFPLYQYGYMGMYIP